VSFEIAGEYCACLGWLLSMGSMCLHYFWRKYVCAHWGMRRSSPIGAAFNVYRMIPFFPFSLRRAGGGLFGFPISHLVLTPVAMVDTNDICMYIYLSTNLRSGVFSFVEILSERWTDLVSSDLSNIWAIARVAYCLSRARKFDASHFAVG
jgi:hypothetical protein